MQIENTVFSRNILTYSSTFFKGRRNDYDKIIYVVKYLEKTWSIQVYYGKNNFPWDNHAYYGKKYLPWYIKAYYGQT